MSVLEQNWFLSSTGEAASATPPDHSPARVLIADADPLSRRVLEDMLRDLGHSCDCAEDGERAYECFLDFRPDVVIVNPTMPGLDGHELCRRIHDPSDGHSCHVISIATRSECDTARAGERAGADDYLTKPFRSSQLEARLRAAHRATALPSKLPKRDAEIVSAQAGALGMARRDPLTGLGNRLALSEDLAALDARTRRYGHSYCIASCTLDRQSSPGADQDQITSDEELTAAAQAIRNECRNADFAYRAGGEEIVVLLPGRTLRSAGVVLERIRHAVQEFGIPQSEVDITRHVTLSAGMATRESAPGESCPEVLARARTALAEATARGQDRRLFASDDRPAGTPEGPKAATTSGVPRSSKSKT